MTKGTGPFRVQSGSRHIGKRFVRYDPQSFPRSMAETGHWAGGGCSDRFSVRKAEYGNPTGPAPVFRKEAAANGVFALAADVAVQGRHLKAGFLLWRSQKIPAAVRQGGFPLRSKAVMPASAPPRPGAFRQNRRTGRAGPEDPGGCPAERFSRRPAPGPDRHSGPFSDSGRS